MIKQCIGCNDDIVRGKYCSSCISIRRQLGNDDIYLLRLEVIRRKSLAEKFGTAMELIPCDEGFIKSIVELR